MVTFRCGRPARVPTRRTLYDGGMTGPTQRPHDRPPHDRPPHDRPHVRLTDRLPHVAAFPDALGTGLLLHTDAPLADGLHDRLGAFIDTYERTLSRFRDDSTVSRMRTAASGGVFDFPDWASGLFDLYDALYSGTDGAIDPCVGEDLIRLGYDAIYSFTVEPDARGGRLGAIHGRPTWGGDVERHGATLVTRRPVALDFGACGKGYLLDLLAGMLRGDRRRTRQSAHDDRQYVIDAGGDMLIRTVEPITIALEDPSAPANAVGLAELNRGAFCASSPSRRHWSDAAGYQLHHLLNAIDGLPVDDVAATWVAVMPHAASLSTALADGLATALFTTSAAQLRAHFDFECAILNANRAAAQSPNFPGGFFTH